MTMRTRRLSLARSAPARRSSRSAPRLLAALCAASIAAAACAELPPPEPAAPPPPAPAAPRATAEASARPNAKAPFENPGGMWTPAQMAEHEAELRKLGLEIDPKALADPMAHPLGAVVSLGGCSASFVSPDGLVATNHHCAQRALQYASSKDENLLDTGFVAKTRADERWNGPTARVLVTQALRDVTAEVRGGLDAIRDDQARHDEIEKRTKRLVAACEKDRPELRCSVASTFGGAQHLLVEQLEIRDVRLVYAPPEGVGNFGGEIDNWRWPRHGGDFSLFRAYVGKDGRPAAHAESNVPYRPKHWLRIATKPLRPGDLVFVAGYPAQTNRLRTYGEVAEAVDWSYPRRIRMAEEYVALLEKLAEKDPEADLRGRPMLRGLSNALTKYRGLLEGLQKGGLAEEKKKLDAELAAFIEADPQREAVWGGVLDEMAALQKRREATRERDAALSELSMVSLVRAATTIVRMAEERPKPDAERDPDFQERNWARREQELAALDKTYHRGIDQAVLELALVRAARLPEADRADLFGAVLGKGEPTEARIREAVAKLWKGTKLEDGAHRIALWKKASTAELQKSKDPLVRLALALRPLQKAAEERGEALEGAMAIVRPRYVEALRAMKGGRLAPDANGTLRVTYGTVRGYRPRLDAEPYAPFTTLSQMVAKHEDKEPFDAPDAVLAAAKAKKLGPYVDSALGDVPVDFLADLDITGGNSGSATLNARGELVGLAFDGNYEAMASDWLFMPSITRSIHVDVRYLLWMLDAVAGGDHLLKEMGVTPAID